MSSLLITGYTGFVGQNLTKYLLENKYELDLINLRDKIEFDSSFDNIAFIHLAGKAHDLKNLEEYDSYYDINFKLTAKIFDTFITSKAKIFIMLSSVKAVVDKTNIPLTEEYNPCPITNYGKSKLLAEKYIFEKKIPDWKRVFVLRPCMIYGPGNKGNLNILYYFINKGIPWPLGKFKNKRSFCSIENLNFIIKELIENPNIKSGVYNIADDLSLSTNDLVKLIAECQGRKLKVLKIPKFFIYFIAKLGDMFYLSLNSEKLEKLTENFEVSNTKIKEAIGKNLPYTSKQGLNKTFKSFN